MELTLRHRDMIFTNLQQTNPAVWGQGANLQTEVFLKSETEKGGTIDVLGVPLTALPPEAVVIDYKFGFLPVPPAYENPQGIAYANRVFENYPSVQYVHVHFIIPALRAATMHTFSREDIARATHALQTTFEKTDENERHPGVACKYCALKGSCNALATPLVRILQEEHRIKFPITWDITGATPDQLSGYKTISKLLEEFAEEAKHAIQNEVEVRKIDLPGYRWIRRKPDFFVENSPGIAEFIFEDAHPLVKQTAKLLFTKKAETTRKFLSLTMLLLEMERALTEKCEGGMVDVSPTWVTDHEENFLAGSYILYPKSLAGSQEQATKLLTASIKNRPGTSYLTKTAKRGYLEMLEDVVDYQLLEDSEEPISETDPYELVEETTPDTTATTDTSD